MPQSRANAPIRPTDAGWATQKRHPSENGAVIERRPEAHQIVIVAESFTAKRRDVVVTASSED